MKVNVNQDNVIELTEVYVGVRLKSNNNETLDICMRDSGFEFQYGGQWWSAKEGVVGMMKVAPPTTTDEDQVNDIDNIDVIYEIVPSK